MDGATSGHLSCRVARLAIAPEYGDVVTVTEIQLATGYTSPHAGTDSPTSL